jgi:adenylate cyclase class 2
MIRRNFDYSDMRLDKVGGWVRVRNEGDKISLSYKQLNDRTVHGTKEVTVVVNDFDTTCSFLEAIGLTQTSIQETKRESWKLGDTEIEIDTWPWIPTFIEIEAKSEAELFYVAEKLSLSRAEAFHGSVEVAYQAIYDVSEAEIDGWEQIRFIDTPDWLLEKVKRP